MPRIFFAAALVLLPTLCLAEASPVDPGGDAIPADRVPPEADPPPAPTWTLTPGRDPVLPQGLSIGGQRITQLRLHPEGVVEMGIPGLDPAAPAPLASVGNSTFAAPFWAPLAPFTCAGEFMRIDGPDRVTIKWSEMRLAGCPADGEVVTFSATFVWNEAAVIELIEYRYGPLPTETMVQEPRAGLVIDGVGTVLELLPDTADGPQRGRAKWLAEGSSDGTKGVWVIELDAAGRLVGDEEVLAFDEDGEPRHADGVRGIDNCPLHFNPRQENLDEDLRGDACDRDIDGDGAENGEDNCPRVVNRAQSDLDADGVGDVCDSDDDNDGWLDWVDRCPGHADLGNGDLDRDGLGDICDADPDGDDPWAVAFRSRGFESCPLSFDPLRRDWDRDGIGDACDLRPDVPCVDDCGMQADLDNDRISDVMDRCPTVFDPEQADMDGDGRGDACDPDRDGNGVPDALQFCGWAGCMTRGPAPVQLDLDRGDFQRWAP